MTYPSHPRNTTLCLSGRVKATPAQAGMELGGQGSAGACLDWVLFLCPFWHILQECSVMCQMACHCEAGFTEHLSLCSSCSHVETSLPLSEPLAYLAGRTAWQEQGGDQHQHCQHFEPSLLRKATTLPTSSPLTLQGRVGWKSESSKLHL